MDVVALGALLVACLVPMGAHVLEKRVRARESAAAA
jgi:hypothetical protein